MFYSVKYFGQYADKMANDKNCWPPQWFVKIINDFQTLAGRKFYSNIENRTLRAGIFNLKVGIKKAAFSISKGNHAFI